MSVTIVSACLAIPSSAMAQATAQFPVQFNFLTPGARSMAMGGAFVGAADDATAAFTNPAGLAFFGTVQVAFEGRFNRVETPFLAGGRISGQPTGIGLDTVPNPVYETDVYRNFSPSFLAVVIPFGGRSSFTAYRHELVGIENTFYYRGAFQRATFFGTVDDRNRDIPLGGTRSVRIVNYGGAVGRSWKSTDPDTGLPHERIALGAGVSLSTFHLDSHFARFGFVSSIFGPDDPTITGATAVQTGDDVSVSAHAGVLWRSRHDGVSIGGTFRRGPSFTFTQRDRVFAADLDLTRVGQFKVPDVWAAGVAWQASDTLRLLVDYDRVQYSQLKTDFIDFQAISSGRAAQLAIDDGNEVHGGAEYLVFVRQQPVALRAGAWFDPDHTVHYVPTAAGDEIDTLLSATLPGGRNLVHATFGAGVGLPKRARFDAAADISSRTTSVTVSVLLRF